MISSISREQVTGKKSSAFKYHVVSCCYFKCHDENQCQNTGLHSSIGFDFASSPYSARKGSVWRRMGREQLGGIREVLCHWFPADTSEL